MPGTSFRLATYAAGSAPRAGLLVDEMIVDAAKALGENDLASSVLGLLARVLCGTAGSSRKAIAAIGYLPFLIGNR
jgi:hypothetical protein